MPNSSASPPRRSTSPCFALAIIVTRPFIARYADRVGHERVVVPCLVAGRGGVALLALADTPAVFVVSALVFGTGFGSAYPIFVAHLMKRVPNSAAARRSAR